MSIYLHIDEQTNNDNEFDEFKDRGLTGLQNLGNTCFINSAIQCLSHTYELNKFLLKKDYLKTLNKKEDTIILMEWDKLREVMWSENCSIQPARFINRMQKVADKKNRVLFTGFEQNDISEFLHFCVDCFHNALSREVEMDIEGDPSTNHDKMAIKCYQMFKNMYSKDYSDMLPLFYGISVSIIKSTESDYVNYIPEPFFNITLPIDKDTNNLYDCFNKYTEKEILTDDNKISNDETGNKENAEKQILFWGLPNILIITLKRFTNNNRKINKNIDFEVNDLDLSKYVVGYDKTSYNYELYGICNHLGSCGGGHYTAMVKNANGNWYHFNDMVIQQINEKSIKSSHVYCLFYRLKSK